MKYALLQVGPIPKPVADTLLQYEVLGAVCILLLLAVVGLFYRLERRNAHSIRMLLESKNEELASERAERARYTNEYLRSSERLLGEVARMVDIAEAQSKRMERLTLMLERLDQRITNLENTLNRRE